MANPITCPLVTRYGVATTVLQFSLYHLWLVSAVDVIWPCVQARCESNPSQGLQVLSSPTGHSKTTESSAQLGSAACCLLSKLAQLHTSPKCPDFTPTTRGCHTLPLPMPSGRLQSLISLYLQSGFQLRTLPPRLLSAQERKLPAASHLGLLCGSSSRA